MDSEGRKRIQIILGIFLVVAIVRVAMIYYERNQPGEVRKPPQPVSSYLVNDMFFLDDPHKIYSYWPSDIWSAIDHHEAKPGMNELQVSLALGTSASASPGEIGERTMEYTNGGKPVTVTFTKNKAVSMVAEKEQ